MDKGKCRSTSSLLVISITRLNSKGGKSIEIKETSKPFPFQTSGKRRATMAFSLSYKKELKALNQGSKDCSKFLHTCGIENSVTL